ncbi:hypothetical protein H4582DRAFT_2126257 [Lactarius indigo]|nr:hypothetical protein H4582DRAFT_2126257 [Lactarius indigo]
MRVGLVEMCGIVPMTLFEVRGHGNGRDLVETAGSDTAIRSRRALERSNRHRPPAPLRLRQGKAQRCGRRISIFEIEALLGLCESSGGVVWVVPASVSMLLGSEDKSGTLADDPSKTDHLEEYADTEAYCIRASCQRPKSPSSTWLNMDRECAIGRGLSGQTGPGHHETVIVPLVAFTNRVKFRAKLVLFRNICVLPNTLLHTACVTGTGRIAPPARAVLRGSIEDSRGLLANRTHGTTRTSSKDVRTMGNAWHESDTGVESSPAAQGEKEESVRRIQQSDGLENKWRSQPIGGQRAWGTPGKGGPASIGNVSVHRAYVIIKPPPLKPPVTRPDLGVTAYLPTFPPAGDDDYRGTTGGRFTTPDLHQTATWVLRLSAFIPHKGSHVPCHTGLGRAGVAEGVGVCSNTAVLGRVNEGGRDESGRSGYMSG